MTNTEENKKLPPAFFALMAIDSVALIAIALCVAELFPSQGGSLGLIPSDLASPILYAAIAVAVVCGYFQIRFVLRRNASLAPHE